MPARSRQHPEGYGDGSQRTSGGGLLGTPLAPASTQGGKDAGFSAGVPTAGKEPAELPLPGESWPAECLWPETWRCRDLTCHNGHTADH